MEPFDDELDDDPGAFGPGSHVPAIEAPILSLKDKLRSDKTGEPSLSSPEPKPRGRPKATPKPSVASVQKDRDAKRKLADQRAGQITGELNDMILRLFVSQGIPPEIIYRDGQAPPAVVKSAGKYTELGSKLVVDDFTARMVAGFTVDLESSEFGEKLVAGASGGPVGLVVKGVVAGACVFMYLKGVSEVMSRLQVLIEANKQYQRSRAADNPSRPEGTIDGLG